LCGAKLQGRRLAPDGYSLASLGDDGLEERFRGQFAGLGISEAVAPNLLVEKTLAENATTAPERDREPQGKARSCNELGTDRDALKLEDPCDLEEGGSGGAQKCIVG
jgi:hypothetical protein